MTTALTPRARNHEGLGPLASRVVHANEMDWEPIRYPGCYVKTLMVDPKQGLLTVLLKMDPGAQLPDHEHTLVEQTYMLEGRLVDLDGPEKGLEVGPGEFVWRPAGSRHSAWTPEGGLMLAVFQVPNKFFEQDGSVVDLVGNAWGTKWGHVVA
ncbi:cupin domain-containing protein [Ramlibacter alkalitolerans]|uniref:Cupin domain-containing protein n=1 Tax=Ramlibacter alkalitolerans TaxID=2039631 RepID=A0ABS1JJM0_9BURK|nr:cupin domain-containing protein [Ramlibacter alkalitolerans]MBL0424420.1 cupin domain-containing protein [Ramlibacter alkalitolerans]